jgi:hypothetical protein
MESVVIRERRTHNKFVVTEDTVIIGMSIVTYSNVSNNIGTSNWSGDYFDGNTGVALVVRQNVSDDRPFIDEMRSIFIRDWDSVYAHTLKTYYELFDRRNDASFCQAEKDPALFAATVNAQQ